MATFNSVEKAAINSAHRDVRTARDALRELIADATAGLSLRDVADALPRLLTMLERAEGNIDVVLGRPRT